MCIDIHAMNGYVLIETPRQLEAFMEEMNCEHTEPIKDPLYTEYNPDNCLCQIDVEATLKKAKLHYECECGDINIIGFVW